jgi:hypothetical protein
MSGLTAVAKEIDTWWFHEYLPRWVAASSGESGEGDSFITQYWNVPLYANALGVREWLDTEEAVKDFLSFQQGALQAGHYDHTVVPDRKIVAYNENGGGIDVIWSRRRADESELQHLAVHFEVAKLKEKGWRVIAIQSMDTSKSNSLSEIFGLLL